MPEKEGKHFNFNKTVVMISEKALDLQMKFWKKVFTQVNIHLTSFYIMEFYYIQGWTDYPYSCMKRLIFEYPNFLGM